MNLFVQCLKRVCRVGKKVGSYEMMARMEGRHAAVTCRTLLLKINE